MSKSKFRPLHDRVVVKRIDAEEKTKGGIIIPDTAKEKPQEGEVLAVGPGRFEDGQRLPLDVNVGDKVDAAITAIDRQTKKVGVSIKALEMAEEKQAVAQYGSTDSGASLGDILGAALLHDEQPVLDLLRQQLQRLRHHFGEVPRSLAAAKDKQIDLGLARRRSARPRRRAQSQGSAQPDGVLERDGRE